MSQSPPTPAQAGAGPDLSRLKIARDGAAHRPRGRAPVWIAVLLLLGGGAWYFRDAIRGAVPTDAGSEVQVALAKRPGGAGGDVTANGYVIPRRRAALSTILSGRLVELNVEEGNEVKAGQVIARIQHDDYDAALVQAAKDTAAARAKRAEVLASLAASKMDLDRLKGDNEVLRGLVEESKARSDRAARDVLRNAELFKKNLIDGGTWDKLQADAAAAAAAATAAESRVKAGTSAEFAWGGEITRREASVQAAEAEVDRAQQAEASAAILVEKTFVRAPFDGLVVHKDAEVGEVVSATGSGGNSRGSVATIIDPKTLEVQVELPETRLGRLAEGDRAEMHLDSSPEKGWPGRVRQVWPTADRQKATVEIRVEFTERPAVLKPEMGVRVTFVAKDTPVGADAAGVRVPSRAVVKRNGKSVVFTVAKDVVRRVDVEVGGDAGSEAKILSGLVGGEWVVIDPSPDLADGAHVRTKESR